MHTLSLVLVDQIPINQLHGGGDPAIVAGIKDEYRWRDTFYIGRNDANLRAVYLAAAAHCFRCALMLQH
jgi:hypothetical protein